MRGMNLKLTERFKSTQVHALNSSDNSEISETSKRSRYRIQPFGSKPKSKISSISEIDKNLPFPPPSSDSIEPSIDPYLKPINHVEALSDIYSRLENCAQVQKPLLCIEQYSLLRGLGDHKLLRRCLRTARQNADDIPTKIVLSAWLRFERREDEFVGVSSMDCNGYILECPKANLVSGFGPSSVTSRCQRLHQPNQDITTISEESVSLLDEESDVSFCIGNEEINCARYKIAALSEPFKAMLYGGFAESQMRKIEFSLNGISPEAMKAVEIYSRTKRLDLFCVETVLELLTFSNRFCCEELKSDCDAHLASSVENLEDALLLIHYGLEERASLLVGSCLQVLLRELPSSLNNPRVIKIFCSPEAKESLASVGYASFLLYYFLSQIAMEESMASKTTLMLLERLGEFAVEKWQKALAFHQLGCVLLERKEYKEAQHHFEAAVEAGHVYSMVGVARTKNKQGQPYSAYKLISSIIFEYKPAGWMYQERALYNIGKEKSFDLDFATKLDPSLSFPYKYRALAKVEDKQINAGITELDRIIGFKLSPDCLELRCWLFILIEDYKSAVRDVRALLTLEPDFVTSHGKIKGEHLLMLLTHKVESKSLADLWMQLYEQWSAVDDIGSLAIIHEMLESEPGKSLLEFRQSLLLLRLNCQKAAMRSLRLARNHSSSMHERLIYEGWILYDTGYREEALAQADRSISIQRSFEAFFLKAYVLADSNPDSIASSKIIEYLEEALKCPSDGLRKGQALNNLGSILVDCGKLELAKECYTNALAIRHTRAHQGLARIYYHKNQRKSAFDEMTKLIEKAVNNASAYEKRSEYSDREMAKSDLDITTQLDPFRSYPYRYRAAVMMDEQKETEAVEELNKAINFRPDLQMLHLRAAFYESMGDLASAVQDCQAALCLEPSHSDTSNLYWRTRKSFENQKLRC